ncbi:MAG: hypothetical protein WBH31_03535 [Promethearchaeia archaeon]
MSAIDWFGSTSISLIAWSGGTPVSRNRYCVMIFSPTNFFIINF